MVYVVLGLSLLMSLCFILVSIKKLNPKVLTFFKGGASLMFILVVLTAFFSSKGGFPNFAFVLLLLGLIFGTIGDVMLALKDVFKNKMNFFMLLGIFCFLIGHLFYIFFFAMFVEFSIYIILFLINLTIISLIILKLFNCELKKLAVPVVIYCIIISSFLAYAIAMVVTQPNIFSVFVIIAAVLFYLSDAVLCFIYFKKNSPVKILAPINYSLYYFAQNLIALLPVFYLILPG